MAQNINFFPVVSSSISEYSWVGTDESVTLILRFKNGGTYRYKDVPKEILNEFLSSPSLGKYFHSNIKDKYITEKLDLTNNNYDSYLEWTSEEEEAFLKIMSEGRE